MVSPLHSQSEAVTCERQDPRTITSSSLSKPTSGFDHLDTLRMGLVEHLRVVDLPDKVPGPQTTSLRYRFLADLNVMMYDCDML